MSDNTDIDLIEYIRQIIRYRRFIVAITICATVFAGAITFLMPKYYSATGTFVLPVGDSSPGLSSYRSLLGGGGSSGSPDSYIKNILKSKRLRLSVAESLYPYIQAETSLLKGIAPVDVPTQKEIGYAAMQLKFNKKFVYSANKDGLFKITFLAESPELAQLVLEEIIQQINTLNETLEIFPKRKIIIVLDEPESREHHSEPRLLFNTIVGFMTGLFFGVAWIIVRHHYDRVRSFLRDIS